LVNVAAERGRRVDVEAVEVRVASLGTVFLDGRQV